jgi:putative transposase
MGSNLALKPGSEVDYGERRFAIMQVISFETVVARDVETGELERLPIAGLRSISGAEPSVPAPDLSELDDRDWDEARRRLDLIQPVVDAARLPRSVMSERARDAGVEVTTLYRWARLYRASGLLSSLLPYKPGGGRGKSRLEPAVEQIVLQTIEEHFLTRQQRTIQSTAAEVARRCREAHLSVPHAGTIRARIIALPVRERLARRSHGKAARDRFEPRPGSLDEAPRPLDFVQIDHTKLDVIVVDEQQRLPIGRPWITLTIDVYSRMVLGFYISLDPPGAIATGQCIAHAALPKETWLAKRGIVGSWPCWGFPARVHLDNAKEFHGEMLRRACEQYGIALEYRPVAQPHLGGHIERLLGTLLRALHELPGATFSNPGERGNYDSQARAVMTLGELERWLTEYIVGVYHAKRHRGIGTSPLQRWTTGAFGDAHDGGTGVIDRPANEERIRLDFLPFVERTVQAYGISIDGIHYYSDVLRRFVGATENGRRRVFVFRRDPRDISTVSFWDPELQRYSTIPYRNTTHPPISIWELRELRGKLHQAGRAHIDEAAIFEAYRRLREREARAVSETKRTRRARARRPQSVRREAAVVPSAATTESVAPSISIENITPFEIEEL